MWLRIMGASVRACVCVRACVRVYGYDFAIYKYFNY